MEKFGIALLSMAHVHAKRFYADQIRAHPDCEIVALWDEDPTRGHAEADRYSVPFHYLVEDVLALSEVDGCRCQRAYFRCTGIF